MGVNRLVGAGLLIISTVSLIQTVRELMPLFTHRWVETTMNIPAFTFAGRSIAIIAPSGAEIQGGSETVVQERVKIDGSEVGAATGRRMTTWRMRDDRRSPEWLKAVIVEDRKTRDSSLWIARRLQASDSERPRIETITVDAAGVVSVRTHAADRLGGDRRLRAATETITDEPLLDFPLSVAVWGVWMPYLWLIYPIGTGVLGFVLLREPRVRRDGAHPVDEIAAS